jgi:hypothetical protein
MLIPSAPGAPLLDLTFFHASVILALDTMYSTDAKSTGDDSVTRQAPKSPDGVNESLKLTSTSQSHEESTKNRGHEESGSEHNKR